LRILRFCARAAFTVSLNNKSLVTLNLGLNGENLNEPVVTKSLMQKPPFDHAQLPARRSQWGHRRWLVVLIVFLGAFAGPFRAGAEDADGTANVLKKMSLEELMDLEVTSVSKRAERLVETASAIQVVTGEDIRRSGALSLPDALRLAPNLQVAQLNSYSWVIGARGFNGNFANKLLVMIDGRSVYTPLFAGVLWDVQHTILEDVDRIEVVSGPGGSLWGANAVNGVINIITKDAKETQGAYVSAAGGPESEQFAAVRYGGQAGENWFYRVYGQQVEHARTTQPTGLPSADAWHLTQGGFRLDCQPTETARTFTLQGELYAGKEYTSPTDSEMNGQNLLSRWTRELAPDSSLTVQAYYDHTWRRDTPSTLTDDLTTWDLDVQHGFALGDRHNVLWGAGYRFMRDDTPTSTAFVGMVPQQRDMKLASAFVQDEIALVPDRLKFVVGTKVEHNSFTGFEFQPSVRLAWTPTDKQTLWSAVSRAVRSPSRFDVDYHIPKAPPFFINGGPDFSSETLLAYEVGYRTQPADNLSLSLAVFTNDYGDIYNVQTLTFPYTIENGAEGRSSGLELAATWQPAEWWRLRGGYTYFDKELRSKPGHVATTAVLASLGNDPSHQVSLHSMMELGRGFQLDLAARYVGELPDPIVPAYTVADVRLAWLRGNWEWAVVAQNLGQKRHPEFGTLQEVPRRVYGKITWRY